MIGQKKRIAICFYGQVRLLETFNLIFPYLSTFLKQYEIDYFISTWNDFNYSKINLTFCRQEYLPYAEITESWGPGHTRPMSYLLSRVGILKRQYEMQHNFQYDAVLVIRPDVVFKISEFVTTLQNFFDLEKDRPPVSILSPLRLDISEKVYRIDSDWMFLMTSIGFDIHSTLYNYFYPSSNICNTISNYREGGHWIHAYYFKYNNFNIHVNNIPSSIIRPLIDIKILRKHYMNDNIISILTKNSNTIDIREDLTVDINGERVYFKDKII